MRDGTRAGEAYRWGIAGRARDLGAASGDQVLVSPLPDGTLVAVVDGLGHGELAAEAARLAIATLEANADRGLVELVGICHRALCGSRGAVISIAVADDEGRLTWTGVGNVEAVVVRVEPSGASSHEHALIPAGVLGFNLPDLRPTTTVLRPGDRIVLATDGISRSFLDDLPVGPTQDVADHILDQHATDRDDALVVVGQYREGRP